jgi:surfactin synthase thioesterase subunit
MLVDAAANDATVELVGRYLGEPVLAERWKLTGEVAGRGAVLAYQLHPELVAQLEQLALIVEAVRRDYRLVETHLREAFPPVSCPISVFTGSDDPELAVLDAPSWTALSAHPAPDVQVFDGDHFYLSRNRLPVVDALAARIDPADLPTSGALFP